MWKYKIVNECTIELSNSNCSIEQLIGLSESLKNVDGVEESYPLQRSMIVVFDPITSNPDSILKIVIQHNSESAQILSNSKIIEVPICYDPSFSLDMSFLEDYFSLTYDQIVAIHLSGLYNLDMFGFIPGFFYLSGLPKQLKIPRKATPAVRVPKGSVAIAHEYTGIYPSDSAGGWYVIGKSPISFFDLKKPPFFNIQVGDQFKFFSISKEEFDGYGV